MFEELLSPSALSALVQVLMIDLVLAGDNAVAVGLAGGGLPPEQRRKAIFWGLVAAVVTRIGFALITTQLLGIVGLLFAGGLLLLWVCWKMWRELRDQAVADEEAAEAAMDSDPRRSRRSRPKTFRRRPDPDPDRRRLDVAGQRAGGGRRGARAPGRSWCSACCSRSR